MSHGSTNKEKNKQKDTNFANNKSGTNSFRSNSATTTILKKLDDILPSLTTEFVNDVNTCIRKLEHNQATMFQQITTLTQTIAQVQETMLALQQDLGTKLDLLLKNSNRRDDYERELSPTSPGRRSGLPRRSSNPSLASSKTRKSRSPQGYGEISSTLPLQSTTRSPGPSTPQYSLSSPKHSNPLTVHTTEWQTLDSQHYDYEESVNGDSSADELSK